MTTLILIILPTMFGILFFYLGMYQERIGWNKLIEKGTLPKPIQEGKTKSNTKPFTGKGRQAPPPFHSETITMEEVPIELEPVLAKISHQYDLGNSQWYEVVYYVNGKWCSYGGSNTFEDGEIVVEWVYCSERFNQNNMWW
jgi:hypothetical protein